MDVGAEEADQEAVGSSRYLSTNIILAGNPQQMRISTDSHTEGAVLEHEGALQLPAEIKPKDSVILDATELAQRYVRPEQDLLDFTDDDMAVIEDHYVRAYAHLDKVMATLSSLQKRIAESGRSEEGSGPLWASPLTLGKKPCIRRQSNRNKALRPFFRQRVGKLER